MRARIIDAIFRNMATNRDIFFVTADMGINLVEKFAEHYPDRFLNVGIAEQNMIGVCAGLANLGYRPFAYTISNFAVHRCFEQIRNEIGLHTLPITILGTSTGYDNAPLGPTHHIVDDWGALRAIPGIDIYCPSGVSYADGLVDRLLRSQRPAYVRIPKGAFPSPDSEQDAVLVSGSTTNTLLITYGPVAQHCLKAQQTNPAISVLVLNKLRPIPPEIVLETLAVHSRAFVVEDHFADTGLYSIVCQFVAERSLSIRLSSIAPREYSFDVGTEPEYFHRMHSLDAEGILAHVG